METKINITINTNLNSLLANVIAKTLIWTGSEKSDKEISEFCSELTKDEDIINCLADLIKVDVD